MRCFERTHSLIDASINSAVNGQRVYTWLWCILAFALVVRLGAAIAVQQVVSRTPGRLCLIAGDAEGYWELGKQLARGKNFEIYTPPRRVLRMPGFPAVLAMSISLFGEDVGRARLVLAMIGTLACGAVFWLTRDLFGAEAGLIATGLAAVSPSFIVFSVMILSEMTFALTLLLSLITLVRVIRMFQNEQSYPLPSGATLAAAFVGGLAAALACYIRPSWLLFPPMVMGLLWIFPQRRTADRPAIGFPEVTSTRPELRLRFRAFCLGLVLVLGLILGLAPWTARNYFVTGGKIVPTTLWMGPSLYDGLNPEANGDSHMEFLRNSVYETMSEYEVDQHYRREAWKWAAKNPGKVWQLVWIKLGRYWNLFPNTPQFDHWYVRLGLLAYVVPVLGFGVWGVFTVGRGTRPNSISRLSISWGWILVFALGPILYFSGLHTLFVSSLRYRLPAEFAFLALTAVGIADCCKKYNRAA